MSRPLSEKRKVCGHKTKSDYPRAFSGKAGSGSQTGGNFSQLGGGANVYPYPDYFDFCSLRTRLPCLPHPVIHAITEVVAVEALAADKL